MSWKISGQSMEFCSCKMFCPCWLGPEGEPDQGWCAAALGFDISEGISEGVDLAGTSVVLTASWPGNFFEGNGKARLYLDENATEDQRRELEAIFTGKRGGVLEPLWGAVISDWLPTRTTAVRIGWGDAPSVEVGDVGRARLRPLEDGAGQRTTIRGAPAQSAFQFETMDLASGSDSHWSDPDLREWRGDSGTLHRFDWSG